MGSRADTKWQQGEIQLKNWLLYDYDLDLSNVSRHLDLESQ